MTATVVQLKSLAVVVWHLLIRSRTPGHTSHLSLEILRRAWLTGSVFVRRARLTVFLDPLLDVVGQPHLHAPKFLVRLGEGGMPSELLEPLPRHVQALSDLVGAHERPGTRSMP